ncbi:MAG: tetratricopeptide repeat protein, partial [Planctomycetes bacterium]|nr:tetratricopeptide repeat protein [Planctomycetota bacterium]
MARKLLFGGVVLMLFGLAVSTARAQDSLLLEMYGQGVHAFNAGEHDRAHELLTMAIDQGSRDPRCYYFRGFAYAKLGRPDEAEADFKQGAELEASGAAVQIDIGASIQRIQGQTRLQLEQQRYSAKLAIRLKEAKERNEKYEQFKVDEQKVLRGDGQPDPGGVVAPEGTGPDPTDPFGAGGASEPPPTVAPAEPTEPMAPEPAASDAGATSDPFADPTAPVTPPSFEPGEPTAPATPDPFGAPAEPAAPAAGADPFGAPAAGVDP